MRMLFAFLLLTLAGCSHPVVRVIDVDGTFAIEHLDTTDQPDGCPRGVFGACHMVVGGVHHVWYSSVSPGHVVNHEKAHVRGMRHGPWEPRGDQNCAAITAPAEGYPLGAIICVDHRREIILEAPRK